MLNNMGSGFAYCKIIFKKTDKPVDFIFLEINKRFAELIGLKKENVINNRASNILPTFNIDSSNFLSTFNQTTIIEEPLELERNCELLEKWLHFSIYSFEEEHFAITLTDITILKKLEKRLSKIESYYQAIMSDKSELSCRFLPDGTLIFVNETYCRYFNIDRNQLIGKNFLTLIPEEDRKKARDHFSL